MLQNVIKLQNKITTYGGCYLEKNSLDRVRVFQRQLYTERIREYV